MERLTRRSFVTQFGRAGLGIVVLGGVAGLAAACSSGGEEPLGDDGPATDAPTSGGSSAPASASPTGLRTQRVDLGFVSAWIVVRAGEAAIVDTGVEGSEGEIEASLAAVSLGFADVSDVIVTHRHPDHQGSVPAVVEAATAAAVWAGAADLAAISSPREVQAVGDGDRVFGLDIIETPGHTAGHLCVHDPAGGFLITGDALNGDPSAPGGVIGANPQFTADMDQANASIQKLSKLAFAQALFGHGPPVLAGADQAVRDLVAN